MEIPKDQILQMLRERGDYPKAELADQQLPTQVDPYRHAAQLARIGIVAHDIVDATTPEPRHVID